MHLYYHNLGICAYMGQGSHRQEAFMGGLHLYHRLGKLSCSYFLYPHSGLVCVCLQFIICFRGRAPGQMAVPTIARTDMLTGVCFLPWLYNASKPAGTWIV